MNRTLTSISRSNSHSIVVMFALIFAMVTASSDLSADSNGNACGTDFLFDPAAAVATANPTPNAGPSKNPLKGWNSGWWRGSDPSKTAEVDLMAMTSVGYQTLEWRVFEPVDDQFAWQEVENILNREGSRGRHIVLQFHIDWADGDYRGPAWLEALFEARTELDEGGNVIRRATDYDDADFIAEATEALTMLMNRYKDDPRIHVIQIGLLGYFGEWHTYPNEHWTPTIATQQHFFNLYKDQIGDNNFLQARYPDHAVTVGTPGMGYTNGWVLDDEHGNEFGDEIDQHDLWVNGPVTGEWPPNREPYKEGSLDEWTNFWASSAGLEFLRTGHYSYVLPPDVTLIASFIPGWTINDARFQQMHRELGYNFQLFDVKHAFSDNGSKINIEFDVKNIGIAPFYEDWDIQLALLDNGDNVVELIPVDSADVRQWMPGETAKVVVSADVELNSNDSYRLGLRILQPGADQEKQQVWGLDARNTYVVVSNDVDVIGGAWGSMNELTGGWNILDQLDFSSTGGICSDYEEFCFPLVSANGNVALICL